MTVSEEDFYDLFEGIKGEDYQVLQSAKNAQRQDYDIIEFPITAENVTGLDYKGSYLNFYVANQVVLLPIYDDVNDGQAISLMQELYPDKTIVPINVVPLYKNGGMIHCITQQQPALRAD